MGDVAISFLRIYAGAVHPECPRDEHGRLWIFGYGSLVWRPAFAHVDQRPASVRGWTRRFWQWSTDHRGVPGAPGRVATLIQADDAVCWGRAYALDPDAESGVLEALDHREKQGYDRRVVPLGFEDGPGPRALMYVATPHNPSFAGATPEAEIAEIIAARAGPSGSNREYLSKLAEALRSMGVDDPHVFALEALLASAR